MIYVWRVPCKRDEYDRLSDTSGISSVYDSDASLLEVKRLTLQLKETLPFEIYSKFPVVLTGKLLDSWMMLDAHSEALQNSTCCRPWVPGWCHPSVHQSLQSQWYLASIAWCQMILAHVLDFLCTSDDPCTCSGLSLHRLETIFVHAIHCAASFYLRHGSKIVRTICRGSSYLIKTLAYLVLTLPWLWAMLLHFFLVPPALEQ